MRFFLQLGFLVSLTQHGSPTDTIAWAARRPWTLQRCPAFGMGYVLSREPLQQRILTSMAPAVSLAAVSPALSLRCLFSRIGLGRCTVCSPASRKFWQEMVHCEDFGPDLKPSVTVVHSLFPHRSHCGPLLLKPCNLCLVQFSV